MDILQIPKASTKLFPVSMRDLVISTAIFTCAVEICSLLRFADSSDGFAYPVFVLAVLLISRLTTGYLFGSLASLLSVVCINYIFTYPYWVLNFTLTGYPITFLTMFTVSIITCTLTTKIKQHDRLRAESEKERMRADLLRSFSHDIRTPLTSIVGATSTLLETPDLSPAQQRVLLADAHDEAEWLIRVVENLLSITRIGDTRTQICKHEEAAEEVLSETVRKFRKRFPHISVKVNVPDGLLLVPMDPILIEQVLANLLENAVIHGETTSQIRLSLCQDGEYASFSVSNNGRGIPPDILPKLFDGTLPRSEISAADGKRNMGLGLSVCMAIIRAHDGTMEAHNLDTGAEFVFRLPLSGEERQE